MSQVDHLDAIEDHPREQYKPAQQSVFETRREQALRQIADMRARLEEHTEKAS